MRRPSYMQSTGHSSTHERSRTSTHGSAITYVTGPKVPPGAVAAHHPSGSSSAAPFHAPGSRRGLARGAEDRSQPPTGRVPMGVFNAAGPDGSAGVQEASSGYGYVTDPVRGHRSGVRRHPRCTRPAPVRRAVRARARWPAAPRERRLDRVGAQRALDRHGRREPPHRCTSGRSRCSRVPRASRRCPAPRSYARNPRQWRLSPSWPELVRAAARRV